MYKVLTTFIFFCLLTPSLLFSKIEAPNYDFSLDSLKVFFPDSTLEQMTQAHGAFELMEDKENIRLVRFNVAHLRYRFPVFVQLNAEGKPLDFFARLPSYFLHDVFHQSIINRFEKQNHFLNKEGTAIYKWDKRNGMNLIYSATCTITCFPIYLSGESESLPKEHESILKKMQAAQAR